LKRAALAPLVAFALAACGNQDWSFGGKADAEAEANAEAAAEADAEANAEASARVDAANGGCSRDSDCILTSLHCDPNSGQCVGCVGNQQCRAPTPYCEPTLQRCVECGAPGECRTGVCQMTTHECVAACTSDADCPLFCSPRGFCVECVGDQNCPPGRGSTLTQGRCDLNIGQCAECMSPTGTSSLQCPNDRPICDPTTDRCVECLRSFDCPPNWVCDPNDDRCDGPTDAGGFDPGDSADEFAFH
jgi:hypothetical protein